MFTSVTTSLLLFARCKFSSQCLDSNTFVILYFEKENITIVINNSNSETWCYL